MESQSGKRETWGSNIGFILAAAGSAIGLGNIWRFPYITGENGGGAFVLIYLLCVAIIGLPVMLCEIVLGRRTQRNPVGAFRALCPGSSTVAHLVGMALFFVGVMALLMTLTHAFGAAAEGKTLLQALSGWGWGVGLIMLGLAVFRWSWRVVGAMGVAAGFIILSFYSVVAGWTIGYTVESATGNLNLDPERQPPELNADLLHARVGAPDEALRQSLAAAGRDGTGLAAELAADARRRQIAYLAGPLGAGDTAMLASRSDAELKELFRERAARLPAAQLAALVGEAYGGVTIVRDPRGERREYPRALQTEVAGREFDAFITSPVRAVGCHFVFILVTIAIVAIGVQKGIEMASKILMPLLVLILTLLIVRALTLEGAAAGVRFYLSPDFSKLNAQSVLTALGLAFFSLSLGMGAMITYGSYVRREQNLFLSTLSVTALDTLVALMAGLAIFPAVFAHGFPPSGGPGLVFKVLPAVFQRMPLGGLWGTLFFTLLFVAALTSAISLLEVVTAYFVDECRWRRGVAATVFGGVIFALGALCAISVDGWDRLPWVRDAIQWTFGTNQGSFFAVAETVSSNWMLPLGGLFICIFVGWIWGTKKAVDEIRKGSLNFADVHLISLLAGLKDDHSHNSPIHVLTLASVWGIFIRFISPVAVLIAFLNTIGWIELRRKEPVTPPAPPPAEQPAPAESPAEPGTE